MSEEVSVCTRHQQDITAFACRKCVREGTYALKYLTTKHHGDDHYFDSHDEYSGRYMVRCSCSIISTFDDSVRNNVPDSFSMTEAEYTRAGARPRILRRPQW